MIGRHIGLKLHLLIGIKLRYLINKEDSQKREFMENKSKIIEVKLPNGKSIYVEATPLGGEQDVSFKLPNFEEISDTIESVSRSLLSAIQKVSPQKASVEFGLEIGVESGQLTTLLVKGSGKSNIKITFEWSSK